MSDLQTLIDWIANAALNAFNAMKAAGIYFYVWIGVAFIFPNLKRLLRALRGR